MTYDCSQIREMITEMLDVHLSEEDIAAVQRHIDKCEVCRAYKKAIEQEAAMLADFVASVDADMDSRKQKVIEAIGNKRSADLQMTEGGSNTMKSTFLRFAAAAAVILICVLGYVYFASSNFGRSDFESEPTAGDNTGQVVPNADDNRSADGITKRLSDERAVIGKMIDRHDVAGLISMLRNGSDDAKILAADALALVGDASALETLEKTSKTFGGDDENNPFIQAMAMIAARIESDNDNAEQDKAAEESDRQMQSEENTEDFSLDVDNTTEGVFGLRVIDQRTGFGIEGAKVKYRMDNNYKADTATDKYGRCEFEYGTDFDPSYLRAHIDAAGYVPMRLYFRRENGVEIPLQYVLELEKGTVIGGFVMTEDEKPIEGAKIKLRIDDNYDQIADVDNGNMFTTSDKEGKWSYDRMPAKLYEVSVTPEHEDYVSITGYSIGPALESLRDKTAVVYMREPAIVNGTVYDSDGNPVPDAKIYTGQSRYSSNKAEYVTDEHGRFTIEKCQYGQLVITVIAKGYAQDMKDLDVEKSPVDVEFYLEPGYTVQVRVVNSDGKPIKGAKVEADEWRQLNSYSERSRSIRLSAKTDVYGLATIYDAPSDAVLYTISAESYSYIRDYEMVPSEEEYIIALFDKSRIVGRVYDAETGDTIDSFNMTEGICWQGQQEPTWQSHSGKKVTGGTYEQEMYYQTEGFAVKIEAEGYHAAKSPVFYNEGKDIQYDIAMYKQTDEQLNDGIVYLPSGLPAAGAQVGIPREDSSVQIKNGMINPSGSRITIVNTDKDGKFRIPYRDDNYRIIVLHDEGIAEVSGEDFEVTGVINLKQWGTVEGTLYVGSKPGAGYDVNLDCRQYDSYGVSNFFIDYEHRVKADKEGRFIFRKVRPGPANVARIVRLSKSSWSCASQKHIEVLPGETITVDIGGGGRTVTGKLEIPGYTFAQIDRMWSIRIQSRPEAVDMSDVGYPELQLPERYFVMTAEEKQQWQAEWMQTAEFKEYQKKITELSQQHNLERMSYPLSFKSDGSFSTEDVLPGAYILKGDLYKKGASMEQDYDNRELIGKVNFEFVVPEPEAGFEDEPVDIGVVRAEEESRQATSAILVGDIAPQFRIEGLNGQTIRLSDYSGKFVILDIGGPMMTQDYIDTLDYLKDVYEAYSPDGRLEVITVVFNYIQGSNPYLKPVKYLVESKDIKWAVGFDMMTSVLGTPSSNILVDYGISPQRLGYILISPDGRIAALKIKPEELMETVSAAIENSAVTQ